ncbi:MAG: hypothetical protein ACR2IE_01455 [Candidatus Sumerlaeaceae bacterium]
MKLKIFAFAALTGLIPALGASAAIEGFETNTDPGNWQASSPAGQTQNATNPVSTDTPKFVAAHVTEGTLAGEFVTTWTIPGAAAGSNSFVSGGPLTYWSIRYNCNAPASLTGNSLSNTAILVADVFNNNPYPIQLSLVVDSASSTQLERGPLVSFPANSAGTYTWNLGTTPATGWVTGDGTITYPARLKTILLYTETEPTSNLNSFFIDNIRNSNAQTDVTAPAPPVPYSAKQGPNSGDVVLTWKANTEPDLAQYKIFAATDANFHAPTFNRLTFPATAIATAAAGATNITLTGQATGSNLYYKITAVDNATPQANESVSNVVLGVRLSPTGAAPADRVIIDADRNVPGSSSFTDEGYFHAIVYDGIALNGLSRTYDSGTAAAVDAGLLTLTPSATGAVIWSNLLDGSSTSSVALTTQSVTALTAFNTADGNLLISGAGLAEDLSTRGASTQAFLTNVLKSSLVNPNSGSTTATISGTGVLSGFTGNTNISVFINNQVAFQTSSNEVLQALSGSVGAAEYSNVPNTTGYAAVVNGNKVVHLGFGFESIGDSAGATNSQTVRQTLLNSAITYLLAGPTPAAASDWQLLE